MIRTEIIIGVNDVEKSSLWYQKLLNCKSNHGGDTFEILADQDDTVVLCLHKWGEHHHPTLIRPTPDSSNGFILYFRVSNLKSTWKNAKMLNANIADEPHLNENSGKEEFSVWDLDGYYLIISA